MNHSDFRQVKDDGLSWFQSSEWSKRGFCKESGSSLFYQMLGEDYINISPAGMANVGDLQMRRHIFVKHKGTYYDIGHDYQRSNVTDLAYCIMRC